MKLILRLAKIVPDVTENWCMAGGALELAAGRNVVVVQGAAARANRLAVRLSPADLAERLVSCFLAALVDVFQGEGPGSGGEEEVLGHLSSHPMMFHRMYR